MALEANAEVTERRESLAPATSDYVGITGSDQLNELRRLAVLGRGAELQKGADKGQEMLWNMRVGNILSILAYEMSNKDTTMCKAVGSPEKHSQHACDVYQDLETSSFRTKACQDMSKRKIGMVQR